MAAADLESRREQPTTISVCNNSLWVQRGQWNHSSSTETSSWSFIYQLHLMMKLPAVSLTSTKLVRWRRSSIQPVKVTFSMELRLEPGGNFYLLLIIVYAYCISVCKTSNQCFLVFFITECLQKKESFTSFTWTNRVIVESIPNSWNCSSFLIASRTDLKNK